MRTCTKCGKEKSEEDFYQGKSHCKLCHLKIMQEYHEKKPAKRWAQATIDKHRQRGFEINITTEELEIIYNNSINQPCFYCGCIMKRAKGGTPTLNSPTLDVIEPYDRDIRLDNIRIICHGCNSAKSMRNHLEYVEHCKQIYFKFGLNT